MSFSPVALAPNRKLKLSGWCVLVTLTKQHFRSVMELMMWIWSQRPTLALASPALKVSKLYEPQTMQLVSSNSLRTCSSSTGGKLTAAIPTPSATCSIRIFWRRSLFSTMEYCRYSLAHRSTIRCSTSALMFSSQHCQSSTFPLGTMNTRRKYFWKGRNCTVSVWKTFTLTSGSSGGGYFMLLGRVVLLSCYRTTH